MADEDMLSDGSSDMGDMSDIEVSDADQERIEALEQELTANPNLYDKHIEYIAVLRKNKMKTRLRSARQAMHTRFPLSAELWLEWLDDELAAKPDRSFMENLFKLAVDDYLSIAIWSKYLRWLLGAVSGAQIPLEDQGRLRGTFEDAVAVGGLHLSEGHELWHVFRDFETRCSREDGPNGAAMQILFRQIQIPLAGNTEAVELLQSQSIEVPEEAKKEQRKAEAMLEARRESEAAVAGQGLPADTNLLAAYMSYIKLEEASGDVQRVQCLYERALAKFPVTHILWQQYALYLEKHTSDHALIQKVYGRAVRNCPWIGSLWSRSLRACERAGGSLAAHSQQFEAATAAGLEAPEDWMDIYLARLDFLRRGQHLDSLWETFSSATEAMEAYFPDYVDMAFRLPAYWATCLLELSDDHQAAKQVWEAALSTKLNSNLDAILAYIAFEVSAKRYSEARSIFRRYHRSKFYGSGSYVLAQAWIRFERVRGSAEDLMQAFIKLEPVLAESAAQATRRADPQLDAQTKEAAKRAPKVKLTKEETERLRQEKDPNFKPGDQKQKGKKNNKTGKEKKQKAEPPIQGNTGGADQATPERGPQGREQSGQNKRKTKGLGFDAKQDAKRSKTEAADVPLQSTFASAGEQDLTQDLPQAKPTIVASKAEQIGVEAMEIDQPLADNFAVPAMPPDRAAAAPDLLGKQDTAAIGPAMPPPKAVGRPAPEAPREAPSLPPALGSDAPSQPLPNAEAASKPARGVNRFRRQAYIKSIAPASTEADIRSFMEGCGTILDINMPLNKVTNKHRGFAYVTFASPESLPAALEKNGAELHGHTLNISVSSQQVPEEARTAFILNLPATVTENSLKLLLQPCGEVVGVKIPLQPDSTIPKGFAYVEFATREGLQNAVDMTGVGFQDKILQIKTSQNELGGPGRGGGRGFNRGGRGGGRGRGFGRGPGGGRGFRPDGLSDFVGNGFGCDDSGRSGPNHVPRFHENPRDHVGEHEPLNVGVSRSAKPRMELNDEGAQQARPSPADANNSQPKSNADFRAMFKKN